MSETKESPYEEEIFDKLTIKAKDTNEIEYLIIFEALTDSIDISCTQINNEDICYNTNLKFIDAKNKHKYLKGAEDCEEILEALSEFLNSIKLLHEGNKIKIIFTIVYLKKKSEIIFELRKKDIFSDDEIEEDENSEKKIEKLQKKVKILTLSNNDLNKKVLKLISINKDINDKFEKSKKRINQIGNYIKTLLKNIKTLTNSLLPNDNNIINQEEQISKNSKTNLSKNESETKAESKIQSKELLYKKQMKLKIEDYNEENIISSNHYNYCFIQLKNSNIAIGFNSGSIGIFEIKYFSQLIQINSHSKDIRCILELSNGNIISCSNDNNIIINKIINDKSYEEIQKIKSNTWVYKIIEINKFLVSWKCESIDIWVKNENNLFKWEQRIEIGENIYGLLQVSEKIFVAHIAIETLHFYNIDDFSLVKELNNIPTRLYNNLTLINDDVLCIGSTGELFLVSISKMEIINVIKVEKCGIESLTFLPNNTLLTGVTINYNNLLNYCFIQFKFNDDNNELIEISRKNNVHDWTIYDLKYVVINGQYKIASSGSMDCKIKIWS